MTPTPNTEGQPMKNPHIIVGSNMKCCCGEYEKEPLSCKDILLSLDELVRLAKINGSGMHLYASDIFRIHRVIGSLVRECAPPPPEPVKEQEGKAGLLPCPHCGCEDEVMLHRDVSGAFRSGRGVHDDPPCFESSFGSLEMVMCHTCGASVISRDAVSAWNRRTPPVQDERLRQLEHELYGKKLTLKESFEVVQKLEELLQSAVKEIQVMTHNFLAEKERLGKLVEALKELKKNWQSFPSGSWYYNDVDKIVRSLGLDQKGEG